MKIVLDMQSCQGVNRYRGIGRYSLSLALEIVKNNKDHEIILLLNGFYQDVIVEIKKTIVPYNDFVSIKIWEGIYPCDFFNKNRHITEILREKYIDSLNPDIVLIFSMFEGLGENIVTCCSKNKRYKQSVILYDLIPFFNQEQYLQDPNVREWYFSKLEHLKQTDILFAISESARNEVLTALGISKEKVLNISSAINDDFSCISFTEAEKEAICKKFNIFQKIILYCGGEDLRKNQEGLITAYAKLPSALRKQYQVVIVCNMSQLYREKLNALANNLGLKTNDVILTGYVSDTELKYFYAFCDLFVFPSFHEGFSLPLLEAMSFGSVCIASNTSSMPEVLEYPDSLFDPKNENEFIRKIEYALTNEDFRKNFKLHAKKQITKFSWKKSTERVMNAFENIILPEVKSILKQKPRLAYISSLPPEKTGIANYSMELLEEMSKYYNLELIVEQQEVEMDLEKIGCSKANIHDSAWFLKNQSQIDRVVYHMGNSPFHTYIVPLFFQVPGVLVLHDFFLSDFLNYLESTGIFKNMFLTYMFYSHSYLGLKKYHHDRVGAVQDYPCNLAFLDYAKSIIVHSQFSSELMNEYYGNSLADKTYQIPLLRKKILKKTTDILQKYDLKNDSIIFASFGVLGQHKCNFELITAFKNSRLMHDKRCTLVFIADTDTPYGQDLVSYVRLKNLSKRVIFTGWVTNNEYADFLSVVDVAIQLRAFTRGETSGTVLDCLNAGIATICNAHGSFKELPQDCVCMLSDKFTQAELTEALEKLFFDSNYRSLLATQGQTYIHTEYKPEKCAQLYFDAIEASYKKPDNITDFLLNSNDLNLRDFDNSEKKALATALLKNFPIKLTMQTIFVDITWLVTTNAHSGIQRVTRSILSELLCNPPKGYKIEPVYANNSTLTYFCARKFTCKFFDIPDTGLEDSEIEYSGKDIFFGLDLFHAVHEYMNFMLKMHHTGVKIKFLVYDLLPVLIPNVFIDGAYSLHYKWLHSIACFDGVICISNAVKKELMQWYSENDIDLKKGFTYDYFHLGQDIESSVPTVGLPENSTTILQSLKFKLNILVVSTIEPRKGHAQLLEAAEILWKKGVDVNLIFVGVQGWNVENLIKKINSHRELNKRFFWLNNVSDEYLELLYQASTVVLVPSIGEGFGLPLIEAARFNKPLIVRDIPVFREIAEDCAYYFTGDSPRALSDAIENWLDLFKQGNAPSSDGIKPLTWKESTQNLLKALMQ